MNLRLVFQSVGTISALILSYFALEVTKYVHESGVGYNSPMQYLQIFLTITTVITLVATGISYSNSRYEHEGLSNILYFCLAIVHVALAPIAVVIATLKIEFGQYWYLILIGIVAFIIWGQTQKEQ